MTASVPSMIGQFNMNNIKILQELGYEVHVACNFRDTSIWTVARIKEFVKELKEKSISYFQIGFPRNPSDIKGIISSYRKLRSLVKKEHYDMIHCHTPVAGVLCRWVAYRQKIRLIYTAHGFHFYKGAPLKNWLIYYPVEWLCSWWTDTLITINKEDYMRAKKWMHAKQTVYVPGVGIDMDKFKPGTVDVERKRVELGLQDEDIMLLSVGELSSRKNHEIVIRAIHALGNPYIKYFICGKGKLKSYLMELIRDIGLEDQIKLLGYRTDISELCQAADLFVFPSHQEGMPVALMEAIACQVPVFCSKIRGNEDLVKDFLFDNKKEDDLVKMLEEMATTKSQFYEKIEKIVQKNYNNLKDYDLKIVTKKMLTVYLFVKT